MIRKGKFLIIAHYHNSGLIRSDTISLIKEANKRFEDIYLISTKLNRNELKKIPSRVKIIIRKNFGYDFYSWKMGIELVNKKIKNQEEKFIFLLGTGLYCLNPKKFLNQIINFNKINKNKVWSLYKSYEISEHLQSDFFSFPLSLLKIEGFSSWWFNIKKYTKRSTIIGKYELVFSNFLKSKNIPITCIFDENLKINPNTLKKKIVLKIKNIFYKEKKIYKKNPTHYFWKEFLIKFGMIKIDLIKYNHINTDLSYLDKILKKKKKKFIEEANNN